MIVSSVAVMLLGVTLWAAGVFDSGSIKPSAPPPAVGSRPPSPQRPTVSTSKPGREPRRAAASLGAHRVFAGRAFSIAYPAGWSVHGAEVPAPWGTDTTIVAPGDAHTMLRVDVTTSPATRDPVTAAEPVIASVAHQPGYRELGLRTGTFHGRPAARWEFLVAEAGVLLHKLDVFFTSPSGTGIAVLTAAPARAYGSFTPRFTAIRGSLIAH